MMKAKLPGDIPEPNFPPIDNTTNQEGSSSWSGKFMQITNKGEMVAATGSGTGEPANSKGVAKIRGEGEMWTQSSRLANLNGAKCKVDV